MFYFLIIMLANKKRDISFGKHDGNNYYNTFCRFVLCVCTLFVFVLIFPHIGISISVFKLIGVLG